MQQSILNALLRINYRQNHIVAQKPGLTEVA
jgi:hypothetical protein